MSSKYLKTLFISNQWFWLRLLVYWLNLHSTCHVWSCTNQWHTSKFLTLWHSLIETDFPLYPLKDEGSHQLGSFPFWNSNIWTFQVPCEHNEFEMRILIPSITSTTLISFISNSLVSTHLVALSLAMSLLIINTSYTFRHTITSWLVVSLL